MSETYRKTLAPRILVLAGVVLIALKVFLRVELLPDPFQTTLGGALGLIGVIWFVVALRRATAG
ncbi:MAG: hypothetical protein KJZ85_13500 [Rhodobacteraceae bacterium]|jgi:hypothetical protein|nr:hypothetical protein [Paracoccaceae bacterium]